MSIIPTKKSVGKCISKRTHGLSEKEMELAGLLMADCRSTGDIQAKLKRLFAGMIEQMLKAEMEGRGWRFDGYHITVNRMALGGLMIEQPKSTKDGRSDAAMYFSKVLLCTIEVSKLDTAAALDGVHKRSLITDRLMDFIRELPDNSSFAVVSEKDLPSIDRKQVLDAMIRQLYYISISPDL